jgi:ABC-type sulfate transport system permease component
VELVALAVGLAVLARGGQRRWPALAAFASVPAALMALNAQIDGLVVLGLGAAFVLWRSDRRFVAGCALGLCLAKPHLVVGLALVLLKRIAYPVERSIPRDEFIFAGGAFRHINEAL